MKTALLLLLAVAAQATTNPPYYGVSMPSGGTVIQNISGKTKWHSNAATADTDIITADGTTGIITANSYRGDASQMTGIPPGVVVTTAGGTIPNLTVTGSFSAGTGRFQQLVVSSGPWLDVRGFGAVGDGATDDIAAVRAAVAVATTNGGGIIYFAPGKNFYLSDEIVVAPTSASQKLNQIWFEAHGSTITSSSTSNVIRFGTMSYHSVVSIHNSGILGGYWNSSTSKTVLMLSGYNIYANTFRDMIIEGNTRVKGDNSAGITIIDTGTATGLYNNRFVDIAVDGFDKNISVGYDWGNARVTGEAPNGQFFDHIVNDNALTYGVYMGSAGYCNYSGNFFSGTGNADVWLATASAHNNFTSQNETSATYGYWIDKGSIRNHISAWLASSYSGGANAFVDNNSTTDTGSNRESKENTVDWTDMPNSIGGLFSTGELRAVLMRGYGDQDITMRLGASAAGNKSFEVQDSSQVAFFNIRDDHSMSISGPFNPYPRTKAQLSAITPGVGDVYSCSNCTLTYDLVVGTGATLGGFRETGTNHGPQ